jgi:hypothetical protein
MKSERGTMNKRQALNTSSFIATAFIVHPFLSSASVRALPDGYV